MNNKDANKQTRDIGGGGSETLLWNLRVYKNHNIEVHKELKSSKMFEKLSPKMQKNVFANFKNPQKLYKRPKLFF